MSDETGLDEAKAIGEIAERLRARFPDATPAEVTDAVEFGRDSLSRAKVRDFVPVLIEKEAKARLKGKR